MNNNNNEKLFHAYIFESRDQKLIFDEALKFFKRLDPREDKRNLLVVEAEKDVIKIDSIRDMIKFFLFKPILSSYKLAIVKDSYKLSDISSNALLKLVEEMPDYGKIIFLTSSRYNLLDTIISRTQLISFESESFEKSDDILFTENFIKASLNNELSFISLNRKEFDFYKDNKDYFLNLIIDSLAESKRNIIISREDKKFDLKLENLIKLNRAIEKNLRGKE